MKKVLIVGPSLEMAGGISTFARGFLSYDFGGNFETSYFDTFAVKDRNVNQSSIFSFRELWGALYVFFVYIKRLCSVRFHTIVINTSSYWGFWEKAFLLMISWVFRKKIVLIIHGGDFIKFVNNSRFKIVIKCLLKLAHHVVFVSLPMKEYLDNWAGLKNSEYIPNPVENPEKYATCDGTLLHNDIKKYKVKYFTISGLDELKRIDDIIAAYKVFSQIHKETCLIIAGSGEMETKLHALSVDSDNIFFEGEVLNATKAELFRVGDVFLNYSRFESFGISTIEAMLCRKVVISTKVGVMLNATFESENPIIVSSKSEIEEAMAKSYQLIVHHKDVYRETSQFAANYSWRILGTKYKALL